MAENRNAPVNAVGYLRVMFTVEDIDDTLDRLRNLGTELVGDVASTKMHMGSATSGAPKEFSSASPKNSGGTLPEEHN